MKRKFTSLLMTVGLLSLLVGAAVPAMVDGNAAVSGAIVAETTWDLVNDAARAPSRGLVMEIPTRPVEPWIRVGSASAKDHQVDDGPVVWGMESHWPALTSSQLNRAADGYSENGGTISGHVYQADGETAIEGATVVVFPGEGEPLTWTLSGADGSYTTPDLPAGEYHLWALAEGYAGEWYQEAYSRADAVAVQVTPPDNVPGVDFTLEPGSSVSGQISRSDDQSPIEGARILAIGLDRFPYAVGWSEADGSYTTTGLLDGQYRILAQVEGYVDKWYDGAYGAHDAAVLTITDDRSGIDFSLEIGGTISGRAVDSGTSQGISDLHINAHHYESGQWVAGANTDHDGYYTLTVPTGSYRVGAHPAVTGLNYAGKLYDDKYHWHEADPVYVTAPGNTPDINFGLEPTVPRDTIEDAIADGAAWLASQQNPDGSWGTYYQVTKTALAVLTLQTHAADLGMSEDPEYPYREHIDQGFSFLLSHAYITGVTPQPAGNPDSNGNGIGVYFRSPVFPPDRGHAYDTYETSIALMAIGASTEPGRIVDVPGSVVDGWSFAGVAQDVVDYLAWGQTDFGFGRGGWNYHPMDFEGERSDQSNTGWVTLGLMYAEDFGATIPHFVKSEIDIWIDYIQDKSGGPDDGGSWYTGPADPDPPIIGANLLRTGNLLQQMAFVGDTESTPRVQAAVDYLVRNWWSYPNCYHTTYTIMKGLEQLAIETVDSIDWFQDFAHAIMNQQRADGGWMPGGFDYAARVLSTTWALLTLQTEIPPTKMGPDLIIAENDAEWVDEGQGTYQVHFTVKNRGNVEAPAGHHVGLVVNDVLIEEKVVPVVLAPGDTYSGIFGTVVTLALPHDKITVCADIYEVIDELNEENNCLTNHLPPAYPDLVISGKYEAWHVEGESYTVHYTVENIGVGPALYGHYVGLRVNGVWIEHRPVPVVLAAGEAYSDSFHTVITLSPVGDEITVCADIYGYVDELDEENNCLTNTLWLEPAWTEFITDPEGDQFHGYGPDIIGIDFHLDEEVIRFRVRTAEPIDQHEVANYMLLDLDLDPSTGFVFTDHGIPTNDIGVDAIALIAPAYLITAENSSLPVRTVCPERPLQTGPAHASSADLLGGLLRWDPGVEDFSFVGYLVVFADTHSFSFAIPLDMLDDDGIMAVVNIIGYIGADDFEPTDVAPNEGHGLTFRPTNAIRTLPSAVLPGEEFEVAVTFISPADGFNSIGLLDVAPAGWTVSVNTAWCTPPANAANPAIPWTTDLAEYLWFGPYDAGVAFTAVYQVQVPADAALDTYTFPGGTLEYYLGTEGPYVQAIVGDFQVEVASARIEGQTREVNCDILLGVTLTLYQGDVEIASTVSNPDGYYTLAVPGPGEYSVVASKYGFRDEEIAISVSESATYAMGFMRDRGLIPNAPGMSYVLACINLWQFGEPSCKLTMSTVLAVINAWQFPVTMHSLTISSTKGGEVTIPGEGEFAYDNGSTVSLQAVAADGYRFSHWFGDATGTSPTTEVNMDRNRHVIANFIRAVPPGPSAFYLLYETDVREIQPEDRAETMMWVKEIIEKRVDALGIGGSVVHVLTCEGQYSIAIQLWDIADIEEAKAMVGLVIVLEFREWDEAEQEWIPAVGTATVNGEEKELVLSSRYFKEATVVTIDEWTRQPLLRFEWDEIGRQLSQQITSRLVGKQLAIYLGGEPLLDEEGRPIAPVVKEVIVDSGQISGLSLDTAQRLSRFLNAGRIPVPLGRWVEAGSSTFELGVPLYAGQVTDVTLTLYVHETTTAGPVIIGARVTGQDGAGNSFDQTVNTSGYVTVTGALGTWSLTVSKSGYDTKSWPQPITATETRHISLSLLGKGNKSPDSAITVPKD